MKCFGIPLIEDITIPSQFLKKMFAYHFLQKVNIYWVIKKNIIDSAKIKNYFVTSWYEKQQQWIISQYKISKKKHV